MTSHGAPHIALPLRTSMKDPTRWSFLFMGFMGVWFIFQGLSQLGLGPVPVHYSDRFADVWAGSSIALGVAELAVFAWAVVSRRRIELSLDDGGISQLSNPHWQARYNDIQVVELRRTSDRVRLAVLELPDVRAQRRLPWWRRTYGLPDKALASMFPASDEPAVRAVLAQHGIVPREFLASDYHDDAPSASQERR